MWYTWASGSRHRPLGSLSSVVDTRCRRGHSRAGTARQRKRRGCFGNARRYWNRNRAVPASGHAPLLAQLLVVNPYRIDPAQLSCACAHRPQTQAWRGIRKTLVSLAPTDKLLRSRAISPSVSLCTQPQTTRSSPPRLSGAAPEPFDEAPHSEATASLEDEGEEQARGSRGRRRRGSGTIYPLALPMGLPLRGGTLGP